MRRSWRARSERRLVVLRGVRRRDDDTGRVVSFDAFKESVRWPSLCRMVFRYDTVELRTPRLAATPKPLALMIVLRFIARRQAEIVDERGAVQQVTLGAVAHAASRFVADLWRSRSLVREMQSRAQRVSQEGVGRAAPLLDLEQPALYISPGYSFGLRSGGQVSHTVGVLNNLANHAASTIWVTSDPYDTAGPGIEIHEVLPDGRFADFHELAWLAFNDRVLSTARHALGSRKPGFIYQRAAVGALAAAELAVALGVPYVLEHNSSAARYARLWGTPLRLERTASAIERATVSCADLVVVVSHPLVQEVVELGADPERVLVNPNGVDPDRYSPAVDGSAVRSRLGLDGMFVFGFLGSFGPYHGTSVLVDAFVSMLRESKEARQRCHLLMVGDGPEAGEARRRAVAAGMGEHVTFTGWTDQAEGPAHMAACDVLVSPHVPNRDGSRFFGSPTKLFEYMAMGKPIIASDLEQLSQILVDGDTASLVPAGDARSLAGAMMELMRAPEKASRLGQSARHEAVSKHTWASHTHRIIDRLAALCPSAGRLP